MTQKIETIIFSHLLCNEEYSRKVLAYLKPIYFEDSNERLVFETIEKYIKVHNGIPTKDVLEIELNQLEGISETDFETSTKIVQDIPAPESTEVSSWLCSG